MCKNVTKKLYQKIILECVESGNIDTLKVLANEYKVNLATLRNYLYLSLKDDNIDLYNKYKSISTKNPLNLETKESILTMAMYYLLNDLKDNRIESKSYYLRKAGLKIEDYSKLVSSDYYKNSSFNKLCKNIKREKQLDLCKEYINLSLEGKTVKEIESLLGKNYNYLYATCNRLAKTNCNDKEFITQFMEFKDKRSI